MIGVNAVPITMENPDTDGTPRDDPTPIATSDAPPASAEKKPQVQTPVQPSTQTPVSRLMYFAQKIIETEGKKLGTACNFFIHRVLQVAGYKYEVFLANDFDLYAKKNFKTFKAEDFNTDATRTEVSRLKKYIWAYPEGTAFIMQWSRAGVHGHIAFVERIGEHLVIYQSSLGTKTPRKDQTTPEILLNGYSRRQLTVYSEMTPK